MKAVVSNPWVLVGAYMALVFVLSSFQVFPQPHVRGIDKPEHYIEYGGLAALVAWAVRRTRSNWSLIAAAVAAVAVSAAYGVTDEVHQIFVPCRECDVLDWVADLLGSITGATLFCVVVYSKRRLRLQPGRDKC